MPTYRVTEVTYVEASSEDEAITRANEAGGEVEQQTAEVVHEGRAPGEAGCPQCGRQDFIEVTASAVGMVALSGLDEGHVDSVEWGALTDVDITEASAFTCDACKYHESVDGDSNLFDALGLRWN